MVDKYTIITIAAIIVIVVPFAYSGMNIFAAQNMDFSWTEEEFRYFELTNNKDILVCNRTPIPVNVEQIRFSIFFENNERGEYYTSPLTLEPGENIVEGKFRSQTFAAHQYFLMEIDSQLTGGSEIRHDLRRLVIVAGIDTPIIGIIPYSTIQQYDALEFFDMMKKNSC